MQKLINDGVWDELRYPAAYNYLHDLESIYDIKYETLKYWFYRLKRDPDWIPKDPSNYPTRIFTEEEEIMAELILQISESEKLEINNELVQNIIMAFYNELPDERRQKKNEQDPNNILKDFAASTTFVKDFRIRHHFSRRKLHTKRRSSVNPKEIDEFIRKVRSLVRLKVPKDHIINVDETFWRCIQSGLYTWAPVGSESVKLETNGTEKDGFTAVATIDAEGRKHDLVLIAAGETKRCEENWFFKNGNIEIENNEIEPLQKIYLDQTNSRSKSKTIKPRAVTDHSHSGWTTIDTWKRYLHRLRFNWIPPKEKTDFYSIENRIYVIADAFPVHHCNEAIEYATILNIELIKIPEGCTDKYQPLGVKIFGPLKQRARSFINRRNGQLLMQMYDIQNHKFRDKIPNLTGLSKPEATSLHCESWNQVQEYEIEAAWNEAIMNYFEILDDEEDMTVINIKEKVQILFNQAINVMNNLLFDIFNIYYTNKGYFQNLTQKLKKLQNDNFNTLLFTQKIQMLIIEIYQKTESIAFSYNFFEDYHYSIIELVLYTENLNRLIKNRKNQTKNTRKKIYNYHCYR